MAQKQSKNRKFDRNRKRSPAMANYRASNRMVKNKTNAIKKDLKAQDKAVLKNASPDAVPRGTARKNRRAFDAVSSSKKKENPAEHGPRHIYNEDAPRVYIHFYGKKGHCVCCSKKKADVVNDVCLSCAST